MLYKLPTISPSLPIVCVKILLSVAIPLNYLPRPADKGDTTNP